MTRRSRLVVVLAGLAAAACSAALPTNPAPTSTTLVPESGALLEETATDTTCRGGYSVGQGKTC